MEALKDASPIAPVSAWLVVGMAGALGLVTILLVDLLAVLSLMVVVLK